MPSRAYARLAARDLMSIIYEKLFEIFKLKYITSELKKINAEDMILNL
jgi:hypothetical protein